MRATRARKRPSTSGASEAPESYPLDAVLAAISDIIVVVGADGRLLHVLPTNAAASLGWTPEEARTRTQQLAGRRLEEVFPATLARRLARCVGRTLAERRLQTIEHRVDVWGERRWFSTAMSALGDDRVVWVSRDITSLRLAFERIASQEAEYRSIFEATSDGLVINDLRTGRLVAANPAFCRMHGYDDMTGMHPTEFIHPNSHHLFDEYLRAARAGREYRCLAQDVRSDGTVFDVEVLGRGFVYQGQPALLGVVRDISERVLSEQQYRGVFEATTDGLLIHELGELRVVEANIAACELFGYRHDELLGRRPDDIILPGSYDPDFTNAAVDGRSRRTRALGIRRDGTTFEMESSGIPFLFRGEPHLLCVQRDITEQVRGEQLLEERVDARTRELATLLEISRNVASTLDLDALLNVILRETRRVVPYDQASFLLNEGGDLVVAAVAASEAPEEATLEPLIGRRLVPRHRTHWDVLFKGTPVVIPDTSLDEEPARSWREVVTSASGDRLEGARSWLGAPLVAKGRVLGLLTVTRAGAGSFDTREVEMAAAVAAQAAVAIENARLYEEAQRAAALDERQRLARELHDSVSQALYGIALGANTARMLLERNPEDVGEPVEYVLSLAEAALAEMRALIFELRPEFLENEGLIPAIGRRVEAVMVRHGIEVTWAHPDVEPAAPIAVREAIFRIVQEALHNVVKHARARRVAVRLEVRAGALAFEVSDDGCGFDPSTPSAGHLGLQSMRERAERLGGWLVVSSSPGMGSSVRGQIPVP